ncbi:sensor histidine kinase [Pontibacter pudoricolor]|uniref:sensor histidine kinase n=1 Tax=Pontibacter pudoricolor TaxID=2694930 RepID=UPI001391B53A|nr:ATP-binding protein [Pontibacter pudoricolor]
MNMNGSKTIQRLIELNDELENYFRNTIIPQLFVDANLILRKFTPPAMKQFSFTPEHIGRPMQEMIDNIRYSTIVENIHSVIESGEIFEKEIQTTDMRWFQMNIIPYLIKKENRANGVIITFVDITDRMKVLKQLEKLNASHETFIYAVSHDLKAPLANIEGLVEHLKTTSAELMEKCDEANQEQEMIAKMLDSSVTRMRTIINELSEIAKIEGNYKEITETVSFDAILNEVELTIKDSIIESQARITYELGVATIDFSPKNLRSILYNLLSNAIKYQVQDRPPEIVVKTEEKEGYVMLSVKDNGLGIAEDKTDLLFTPYTRIEKDIEGTGIGLYLVKKLVENAEGKIEINSTLNQGTEFVIYLKPIVLEA